MNMQALMKKAQQLQKEMLEQKESIEKKVFIGKSSIVEAYVKGTKIVEKIIINEELEKIDDKELLEDMIQIAINDAMQQINKETEEKMGKFSQSMPGLF